MLKNVTKRIKEIGKYNIWIRWIKDGEEYWNGLRRIRYLRIVKKWIEEIEKCNMGSRDANKERRIRRV